MPDYEMHDSGTRQKFETGAQRDIQEGKGRFDLISPIALRRLAKVMEKGAGKYGDRNWEKGIPMQRFMDSALRHLADYLEGKRDEDHLAQAAFNVFGMIHTEEMIERSLLPSDLDEMPNYVDVPLIERLRQAEEWLFPRKELLNCFVLPDTSADPHKDLCSTSLASSFKTEDELEEERLAETPGCSRCTITDCPGTHKNHWCPNDDEPEQWRRSLRDWLESDKRRFDVT